MVDFINFFKSLIYPNDTTRKRKIPFESPTNVKLRKINSSMAGRSDGDEWFTPSSMSRRSNFLHSLPNKSSNNSKENVTVIIDDDDDDVLEVSKSKSGNKFSSTPNPSSSTRSSLHLNGNGDDITFLKYTKSSDEKMFNAKKNGFDYVKPYSYLSDNSIKLHTKRNSSSKYPFTSPILASVRNIKSHLKMGKPLPRSAVLDESFRLDEKMKYKQLLAETANYSDLRESFSKYSTPVGRVFAHSASKRNKQLVDMALNKNESNKIIDLTNGTNGRFRRSLSTKDTIKKVLDDFSIAEPIIIKDSDSDIEILPRPPSPKPDIKVEPVNSMKKIIDTSQETRSEWLTQLVARYQADMAKYNRDVENQLVQVDKIAEVNSEINQHRLEDQMTRCLKIKDIVLPHRLVEDAFQELSEDDECRIDHALLKSKRANSTEVLVQKFNLNITRADIQTLDGLNWLNDEVINFYMNLLIERGKDPKWPKTYAMNTFFYPKLLKDGHSSLRRWTRRVDIFSYEIVAVPIHLGMHWCMAIINLKNCTIQYYDSMGNPNNRCLQALRNYLKAEHLDKKGKEFDMSKWVLKNVANIPQQMNGSDCGVFSCTYAEFITRNADLNFGQENMPYLRRRMILEILNGELLIK